LAVVLVIVIVAVALVVVAGIVLIVRAASGGNEGAVDVTPEPQGGPRPQVRDFHVRGEEAQVHYGVPLPAGEVGAHLRGLLYQDAIEVVREKRTQGLPIDQVQRIRVFGVRDGTSAEVGVVELPEPGQLPEVSAPDLVPHDTVAGYDPLTHLGEQDLDVSPGVAARSGREGLPPFQDEIEIPGTLEASLRAVGTDPRQASLEGLSLDLLRIGGYQVVETQSRVQTASGASATEYHATRDGRRTLLVIVPHEKGEYPELSETTVNRFIVAVAQDNPDRALLVSDKFGPFMMYDKEKHEPRCRFITRERLQAFVDSFALS
jgi:hypothetical protein